MSHELAHAWERHHVDEAARQAYLAASGLERWNDAADPWRRRGIEQAANVIAWGLRPEPLPPQARVEFRAMLDLYELLTGRPSPRVTSNR